MNELLDTHRKHNPKGWRQLFTRYQPPSALALATSALEECRRMQLDHKQSAEYHTAMVAMLAKRETRLVADVRKLSRKAPEGVLSEDELPQE